MASSSPSSQFRLALLRVARQLKHENVQQLAFLCEHISPNRRRELKDAMDLFDQLQEHAVLHEKNVNILIDWLDELQLEEASRPLKTYRRVYLEEKIEVTKNCTTHGDKLTYFCITCNCNLCPKCYISSHNYGCEVIELNQLPQEMESRKAKLKKELESLQKLSATSENITQNKHTQKGVSTGKIVMFTNPGKLARDLFKGLHGKQSKCLMQPASARNEIAKEGAGFQNMIQPKYEDMSRPKISETEVQKGTFQKVREVVERKQSRDDKRGDTAEWYAELSRDSTCGLNKGGTVTGNGYRELCRGNTFGLPSVRCFVGGVMIRENQLVHVFNESKRRSGVLFVCIDPSDTNIEYWRHLVAVDDNQTSPVVMSNKEMKYGGINHVLFAFGKMVYILHPQRNGVLYDSVQSVASLLIDEVGEDSWITSIAAHRLHSECDEFLISISGSNVLREYQISGRPLRTIDTKGCIPSVSISYVQNIFAVCGRRNNVSIFRTDNKMKPKSEFLKALSDSGGLLPVCVIWTGDAGWMVLFVSNKHDHLEWRVLCYDEEGMLLQVCAEGISPRYKGVPVSITRWGNTGFISFTDSSVKAFQY
ncbi:hypothetical protein HOLleu_04251 [Holothuria leucospilota]|uniref:Uncharacterized protein n=1 Tax=Holothuria leucospilota TaxID=206669 RepID=A0A9Q1HLR9_HOLLE|nr:hypothetical protein HOLleu_04251 [Holothuria leucospilota]